MNEFLLTLALVCLVLAFADAVWHRTSYGALVAAGLAFWVGEVLRYYTQHH